MRNLSFILAALIFCFISAEAQTEKLNPNSSKECSVCHYEWMPEFLFDNKGTPLVEFQKEKVVADERMCFSCHNGTVGDSRIRIWTGDVHNLDKIPASMHIPETLPLNAQGKMDCRTCHSAHSTGTNNGVADSVFLRMDNKNSELCMACHKEIGSEKMGITHPLTPVKENTKTISDKLHHSGGKLGAKDDVVCESCHTAHSPKDQKLLISSRNNSQICATCHTAQINDKDMTYNKGLLNHPVNVSQDNKTNVNRIKADGGIYGTEDQIICLTCHTAHKGKTKSLTYIKTDDSALCLTCHIGQNTVFGTKHDMKTIKGFVTKDGKTAQEKGTCESCHGPHGWALKLPGGNDDLITQGCLSCHDGKGIAKEKIINPKLFNHPVGKDIKDDMKINDKLPLFGEVKKFFTETGNNKGSKMTMTCATCHDTHSKDKNFLRVDMLNGNLCIVCHDNKKMIDNTAHGKDKLKNGCVDCHKIHNSDNKKLLLKKQDDGCLDCHKAGGSAEKSLIGDHSHPVNMKTKGKIDEKFKITDDNFTCTTCHDPHIQSKKGFVTKDFIRGGFSDYDTFCLACHADFKEVVGTNHDMRDKKTAKDPVVCAQCHSVHKAKTDEHIMALEYTYKTQDDYCYVCHNEKGSAPKKTVNGGHKLGKIEAHEKYGKFLTEKDGAYYLYCSSCHTVHQNGSKKGEDGTFQNSFLNKELMAKGNFCQSCHDDKMQFAKSKHNPVNFEKHVSQFAKAEQEGNNCGVCHVVHNSGYYMFDKALGENFETICKSCHSNGKVAEKTAITTSHPTNVEPKDKSQKLYLINGKIVCSTCHDVHGDLKDMLRETGNSNMCLTCHADQKSVVYSEHNLAMVDYMTGKVKETAKENPCYVCHTPHNFHKDNKLMWAFENSKKSPFAFSMCTDCHKVQGYGYKKIPAITSHDRIFKIFPYREQYKQFLYDDNGKISAEGSITCQTCHDAHVWKQGSTKEAYNVDGTLEDSFLKLDVKNKFCTICHGDNAEDLFNKYHDKAYRDGRNKAIGEAEVMKNLFIIQMNLQKLQGK